MAFEIRKVDRATFDAMWTPKLREQVDGTIYSTENWIDDVEDKTWVIDDVTQTSMLKVAMANRMDGAECYLLVQHGEYALIRKMKYGTYALAETSAGFSHRIDEVKKMAANALLLGGTRMAGNPDTEFGDITKIPYVNFIEYIAQRIGD